MSHLLVRFAFACLTAPLLADDTLVVFVSPSIESSATLVFVRDELSRILEPGGLPVDIRSISERRIGEDFSKLIVATFRGSCRAEPLFSPLSEPRSLASTAITNGNILPFATIECENLRKAISPALAAAKRSYRDELFGRALGRVLAHEIYHMLAQTRQHKTDGVSKPCFSFADLTAPSFTFDAVTLAQLRPTPQQQPSNEYFTEELITPSR